MRKKKRFLTGQVDKRTLEKYEKEAKEKGRESWYLSWSLDTNPEERDRVLFILFYFNFISFLNFFFFLPFHN